jgi:hypothetical protein
MISYTPEDLSAVIADKLNVISSDPLCLLSRKEAVERIRRRYRVPGYQAEDMLFQAAQAGAVIVIKASVSGHSLWQLKPIPGDGIKFQWDVFEGSNEGKQGLDAETTLDQSGLIHESWILPNGTSYAPDDSEWVTTSARFKQLVETINVWAAGRTAEYHAHNVVRNAAIDISNGDDIDQIAGLLWLAGIKDRLAISPHIFEGRVVLTIDLRDPGKIAAVAELLRKAGFPTDENWRKFL